ncbi:MAG: DegV family protein, partial [Clostridium sp.]
GRSASEILEWLKEAAQKTESFLIPQDFSFLKRGGRLTPVAAALGSVLKLKPVMKLTEDGTRIDNFFVKRTMSAAVKGIMEYMKQKDIGQNHILYIVHAAAKKEAENIRTMFETAFAGLEIHILELSPVFVAQGGPKCVAIQYIHR